MIDTDELRRLAEAAMQTKCEAKDCPYFGKHKVRACECNTEWVKAMADYCYTSSPKRILALLDERNQMQRVIDAARAMRGDGYEPRPGVAKVQAFDTALAALEQEGKG